MPTPSDCSISAKKEAKRLEKEAKLAAESAKTPSTPMGEKKAKIEKAKKAEDASFVNITPKGEKKGKHLAFFTASYLLNYLHQISPSQWLMVIIQLRLNLPGMTGGKPKATSLLRRQQMGNQNLKVYSSFLYLLLMSPGACTLAMP